MMMENILYVSCVCSKSKMQELYNSAQEKPHPAPQKYHSLMVKGLVANGQKVTCLVSPPVTKKSHPNKLWWKFTDEVVDGVRYVYMPFLNSPIPKLLGFKIFAFVYTLFWAFKTKGRKAMICDVLNTHASPSMKACWLVGITSVGIVTDIPGMMSDRSKLTLIHRMLIKNNIRNIRHMSRLVPLTEAMCDIINPMYKIPYIVVEGLVDNELKDQMPIENKDGKRHITYTGTLDERYGVRMMIMGFMSLKHDNIILDIYGNGPMAKEMDEYMKKDPRIFYHGSVTIDEAVKAQQTSFLLVNPRPTKEEFTKYSFPSKNMEYMATGIPLLTSRLPGMPEEYYPYVFIFDDETDEGIARKMNEILEMPVREVKERGLKGKSFVMNNKNNISQALKVLKLMN